MFVGLSRGSGILLLVIMASIAVFLSYRAAIA
ncbi:phosphate ABC transporter permease subunit PstC, partial [Streptomyces cavourensis]|nr:phosphate ABC transporter permease subunit PstC [Streptomyces cavourensis]